MSGAAALGSRKTGRVHFNVMHCRKHARLGASLNYLNCLFLFVVIMKGISCISIAINKLENKLQVTSCQQYFKLLLL